MFAKLAVVAFFASAVAADYAKESGASAPAAPTTDVYYETETEYVAASSSPAYGGGYDAPSTVKSASAKNDSLYYSAADAKVSGASVAFVAAAAGVAALFL
ncbi:hypothetical protein DFJ73DRAFT_766549 [Zopfochytrium polystomum]|nr:hypothetical protein DFJ73DRAFT_766549 [Zopfochytrium polystomum]